MRLDTTLQILKASQRAPAWVDAGDEVWVPQTSARKRASRSYALASVGTAAALRSGMLNTAALLFSLASSPATAPAHAQAPEAKSAWRDDSFTLEVVADEAVIPNAELFRAAEAAAQTWNDNGVGPQIVVVPAAQGVAGGFHMDGHNTLTLVTSAWDGNPQAAALTMRSVVGGGILEVDTKVNAADWGFIEGSAPGRLDLQSVLTHEFGHTLGLVDDFDHEEATMFYGSKDKDTSKRDLSALDTGALASLYAGVTLRAKTAGAGGAGGCDAAGLPAAPVAAALVFFLMARVRRNGRRVNRA